MVFFLSEKRMKADFVNDNLSAEYIRPAMITVQTIYLKEIIGDKLYSVLEIQVKNNTLEGLYKVCVDDYIIPYMEMAVMAEMTVPSSFKQLNAGLVQAYDANLNTNTMETVKYMESYWLHKAEFYQNRLTKWLTKSGIEEYKTCACGDDQITAPGNPQRSCGIYLGK